MKSKRGFLLSEVLIIVVLCSVMFLWSSAVLQIIQKKEALLKSFEEEINQTWEEIYASLSECAACAVKEEERKEEY